MVDYGFRSSSILDLDLLGLPKNGTTSLPCPNLAFLLVLLLHQQPYPNGIRGWPGHLATLAIRPGNIIVVLPPSSDFLWLNAATMMGCPGHYKTAFLFSILSLAFPMTLALPILAPRLATRATLPELRKWETNADNDLYGKGVRVGLYLQWASGFILRNLESWETRSRVRTISNTLCAAIALATVVNVLKGSALSIDYLLSYYLTVVLFC